MALYIHPENQRVLWTAIQRHVRFVGSFPNEQQAQTWFRGIIKTVYDTLPLQQRLTSMELNELDQKTINYMIHDLESRQKPVTATTPIFMPTIPSIGNPPGSVSPRASGYQTKSDVTGGIQDRFAEKQRELESFQRMQTPTEIDFKMVEMDEPITNMDELIQQHMRDREEASRLIPPPATAIASASVPAPESEPKSEPKSVTWGENQIHLLSSSTSADILARMMVLEHIVADLREEVRRLTPVLVPEEVDLVLES